MLWNFSEEPADVDLVAEGGPSVWTLRRIDFECRQLLPTTKMRARPTAAPAGDDGAREDRD